MDQNLIYTIIGGAIGIIGTLIGVIIEYLFLSRIKKKETIENQIQKMKSVLLDFRYNIQKCYDYYVNKYNIAMRPLSDNEVEDLYKSTMKDMHLLYYDLFCFEETEKFGKKIRLIREEWAELVESLFNKTSGWKKQINPDEEIDSKYLKIISEIDSLLKVKF
jgi:hypothetical protein